MKAGEFILQATRIMERAGDAEARIDAEWMLCDALGIGRGALRAHLEDELDGARQELLERWVKRRARGEPLGYVQGRAYFMGLEFAVDARVLIPRQDTETLCEAAIGFLRARGGGAALDLCTGSGALAVAIAKACPGARVSAADISGGALEVAQKNARAHGARVRFYQGDLFAPLPDARFDLIVTNPPYISDAEMETLQREVRWEPALALRGGADGLDFYRRIACEAGARLSPGGALMAEVGAGQSRRVAALFEAALPDARLEIARDLNGIERVVQLFKRTV